MRWMKSPYSNLNKKIYCEQKLILYKYFNLVILSTCPSQPPVIRRLSSDVIARQEIPLLCAFVMDHISLPVKGVNARTIPSFHPK